MKKTATLISAVCALGLLCAGAVYVSGSTRSKDDASVFDAYTASGEISLISYKSQDSERVELSLNGDIWESKHDADFPVNQSLVKAMEEKLKAVSAYRKIENVTDLAQYGIDSPALSVSVTGGSESATFFVGSQNTHTQQYYFAKEGESTVYTIDSSFLPAFDYSLFDLAVLDKTPSVTPSEIDKVILKQSGEEIVFEGKTVTADETQAREYTVNGKAADKEKAESYFYSINSVLFDGCAAFKPESLSDYGLSSPDASIEVFYTKQPGEGEAQPSQESFKLLIGGGSQDGERYVMLQDSNMICTMQAQSATDLTAIFESDFLS